MCNSVKAVSAVVASQPVAGLFFAPDDKKSPAQRIAAYLRALIAATKKEISSDTESRLYYLESYHNYDLCRKAWDITVPELAGDFGFDKEFLYGIGDDGVNPPHPAQPVAPVKVEPVKVEAKVEPTKLKTRILPGGVKRYVHVFAPALKERFDGKSKDNPLCCVRVGSNPKRFKMYRGVEFLAGASLEELPEPLAGTNGRAICVMVTTGPIRVSY